MILKLHAETPFVKGYNRGCIYDLPRRKYDLISNEMVVKINSLIDYKKSDVNKILDNDEKQWLNFLIENEYCFFIPIELIDCFPQINLKWESPSIITNTIIDVVNSNSNIDYEFLQEINCKHLLIRFYDIDNTNDIFNFFERKLSNITLRSIDLIIDQKLNKSTSENKFFFKQLFKNVKQLTSIRFSEKKKEIKTFVPRFSININMFSESQEFNVYFNRKLYIDGDGNIKNGIETKDIYGKMSTIRNLEYLTKKLKSKKLQELWIISKDKIDICKDCEFRYMCIDNRIPIKRNNNSFFFNLECSYNPYISKWLGDPDYYSLIEIGITSNEIGFSINHQKIRHFNQLIWNNA